MLTPVSRKSTKIQKTSENSYHIKFYSERGVLRLAVYKDDMIRISFANEDNFPDFQGDEFYTLEQIQNSDEKSLKNYEFFEKNDKFCIKTAKIHVEIDKNTASVKCFDLQKKLIFSESEEESHILETFDIYKADGNIKTEEVKTADGVKKRISAADKIYDRTRFHTKLNIQFQTDEKLFGLGQAEEGVWNLRGTTQYLHQANKKIAIPFLVSSCGYGLLFSTQSPAIFNDNQYGSYFYTEADYYLDYFLLAGDAKKVVATMRELTGKAVTLPKYAYGYIQSQERYETQQEILDTAEEFKHRNIPLSLIVLDWLSWEDGMWGQKSFDKKRFPDVEKMVETLHKDDVHFMISIWPCMDERCENYKEMAENHALLTGINICNAFDPVARSLYWNQAKEGLAKYGVESWWCDSSEPVTPEWNHVEKQLPECSFSEYVKTVSDVMPVEKSNAYGMYHAKGMFEGQKKDYPDRDMLILTRSGYFGSQKYGVALWSGDTSAKWCVLKNQVVQAVQFSLSGIPYWTVDIGGFFVKRGREWYWDGDYDNTLKNPGFCELYTRWFEFGAFLPLFRAHGTDCHREPWAFLDSAGQGSLFYDILVYYIKLRNLLLPYIYKLAENVYKKDEMFIRPLFAEFCDEKTFDISQQFMFGNSIMVCPVTEPMYFDKQGNKIESACKMSVYLPAGCGWYNFWDCVKNDEKGNPKSIGFKDANAKLIKGGQTIVVDVDLKKMPLFIREGFELQISNL